MGVAIVVARLENQNKKNSWHQSGEK